MLRGLVPGQIPAAHQFGNERVVLGERLQGTAAQQVRPGVPDVRDLGHGLLAVSGFGAWRIVRGETGVHLFELPAGGSGRTFNRVNAEVVVAAQPDEPRERDAAARRAQAERAIEAVSPAPSVIRRYREEPSPLVRDTTG